MTHLKNLLDIRTLLLLALGMFCALFALPAIADDAEQVMNWGVMGMQLFGGLALFLFGMEQMAEREGGRRPAHEIDTARLTSNRIGRRDRRLRHRGDPVVVGDDARRRFHSPA